MYELIPQNDSFGKYRAPDDKDKYYKVYVKTLSH